MYSYEFSALHTGKNIGISMNAHYTILPEFRTHYAACLPVGCSKNAIRAIAYPGDRRRCHGLHSAEFQADDTSSSFLRDASSLEFTSRIEDQGFSVAPRSAHRPIPPQSIVLPPLLATSPYPPSSDSIYLDDLCALHGN